MRFSLAGLLLGLFELTFGKQLPCTSADIPHPQYFGTQITNLIATEVRDYAEWGWVDHVNIPSETRPLHFCNVTVTYTHPGLGDSTNVYIWLPLDEWNGRFLAQGGGGWASGSEGFLAPAVGLGYASANTDTGHTFQGDFVAAALNAKSWALKSPGNVNWVLLQDYASIGLDDMANLAKNVIAKFYGKRPKYSYWNGCSGGGRSGMINAQRYPRNYDGLLIAAPAINWQNFIFAQQWGHIQMRKENYAPPKCELDAITQAAIEACDEIDGVKDGVVAAPGLCTFNAESVVGREFDCKGERRQISESAAKIVNAAWEGPRNPRTGEREWFGITHETPLAGEGLVGGLLQTFCDEENKNCRSSPFPVSNDWVQLFLAKDPEYDVHKMTEEEFFKLLHQSRQDYTSIIGTDDPDLSEFKTTGGKMITWHGLADELIYPNGTSNYYERVLALDPETPNYYRHFEAPGAMHCAGGIGAYPRTAFNSLIEWVEKGKPPEQLDASTTKPINAQGPIKSRPLCPYPSVAAYKGGNPDLASSFECATRFGNMKAPREREHDEL